MPPTPPTRSTPEILRLRVRAHTSMDAEIAAAEAWESGASGVVEEGDGRELTVYLPAQAAASVVAALRATAGELEISVPEPVEDVVWSEAWKQVLQPVEISPRLVVAPSFATPSPAPGQHWVRIEPGQAFGTGAHHSTHLALEGIDSVVSATAKAPRSLLDVGTGSGVLALAGLALGVEWAVGFDLDPLAAAAARSGASENGLAERAVWFAGPIEALRPLAFDLVVANLLRSELLPVAGAIAQRVAAGGALVLAGLLEADAAAVHQAFAPAGLCEVERRTRSDGDGDPESWLGLVLRRG